MKIFGKVEKNLGRGKELGFPTANVKLSDTDKVEEGVYTAFTVVDPNHSVGVRLPSLVFVGANETFGETERRAEVFILDFDQDIYGEEIDIELVLKLRGVRKFENKEELIEQMKKDEQEARIFFGDYNLPIN